LILKNVNRSRPVGVDVLLQDHDQLRGNRHPPAAARTLAVRPALVAALQPAVLVHLAVVGEGAARRQVAGGRAVMATPG
jgi:hypothetical protein